MSRANYADGMLALEEFERSGVTVEEFLQRDTITNCHAFQIEGEGRTLVMNHCGTIRVALYQTHDGRLTFKDD